MVRIDKEAQEYYAQLTAFYQQFRRIGNNYNQCVKTIHTIYGEKKSLAFLYKLAEETRKLEEICRQVIELTKRYEKEYLTKSVSEGTSNKISKCQKREIKPLSNN